MVRTSFPLLILRPNSAVTSDQRRPCTLPHSAEACGWLKDHANVLRQLLDSSAPQPQLLASLLHIIKRLCQTDGTSSVSWTLRACRPLLTLARAMICSQLPQAVHEGRGAVASDQSTCTRAL
jgi:hypothetical protein